MKKLKDTAFQLLPHAMDACKLLTRLEKVDKIY